MPEKAAITGKIGPKIAEKGEKISQKYPKRGVKLARSGGFVTVFLHELSNKIRAKRTSPSESTYDASGSIANWLIFIHCCSGRGRVNHPNLPCGVAIIP